LTIVLKISRALGRSAAIQKPHFRP
jgi:hypothetical protein